MKLIACRTLQAPVPDGQVDVARPFFRQAGRADVLVLIHHTFPPSDRTVRYWCAAPASGLVHA